MTQPERGQPGRLRPTRLAPLFGVAGVGLVVGWFGVPLLRQITGSVPSLPWTAVGTLLSAAVVLGGTAWQTWHRLQRNRRRIDAQWAVNLLVLAKASVVVGALVAGVYAGYGLHYVDDLGYAGPADRALRSGLAVLAGVSIVAGGLWLERACKVPDDESDEDVDGPGGREDSGPRRG